MVVWRCPHCATPQAEAARCWVCHRSTTSCATCRHFRRSVASGFGICGLDPSRVALTGSEMRTCWTAPDAVPEDAPARRATPARPPLAVTTGRAPRTFVPVEELASVTTRDRAQAQATATAPLPSAEANETAVARPAASATRWSLWEEPER